MGRRDMEKVFNDCVHGHIKLHPLCVKVIDTPQFQRLRDLKQLGFAYYVYPGASHNRFEHSLGVCHLAGLMLDSLVANTRAARKWGSMTDDRPESEGNGCDVISSSTYVDDVIDVTPEDKLCVQLAGLCHDLGHGPFSHTWETALAGCGQHWHHETASIQMFDHLIKENDLIGEFEKYGICAERRELIKELIKGEGTRLPDSKQFLYQIVANKENDIDVDKWDYFLRDGLQLNVMITFDYRRLLEFCMLIDVEADESGGQLKPEVAAEEVGCKPEVRNRKLVIGFKEKEKYNVLDMFRVRADLHVRAYQHPVVKNIDLMWIDAMILANDVYRLHTSTGEQIKLSEAQNRMEVFTCLTDHIFYSIYNDPNPKLEPAKEILSRILKRQLYTYIGDFKIEPEPHWELAKLKKRAEKLVGSVREDLRCCFVKIDLGQHSNPMARVVLYDGKLRGKPCQPFKTQTDITEMQDCMPVKLSTPVLRLNVYSTISRLPDNEISFLQGKIRTAISNFSS